VLDDDLFPPVYEHRFDELYIVMSFFIQLLIDYGLWGMFVSAFLAGSVLPFSSELVMLGLIAAGVDPVELFWTASIGNTLGGLLNYGIGTLGNPAMIAKWTHVKEEKLNKGLYYARRYGYFSGLLAWVPLLGSVITVALGFVRVNFFASALFMAIGKSSRYAVIMFLV